MFSREVLKYVLLLKKVARFFIICIIVLYSKLFIPLTFANEGFLDEICFSIGRKQFTVWYMTIKFYL